MQTQCALQNAQQFSLALTQVASMNSVSGDLFHRGQEFQYFQIALNKILTYYNLITFGEDAEGVKSSFNELLMTKTIKFQEPTDDDWAYSYLETVNIGLEKKGLVALITKGHYDIIVCKADKKDEITNLFQKIQWDFIQP